MGNTDKHKTKKCRRKIRIRLADPNIPDSYVCEIFDSSLENEEENSNTKQALNEKEEDSSKPKNYFELLMSKKGRKNYVNNSGNESEVIQFCSDEDSVKKNKNNRKHKNSVHQIVVSEREERICESDSSDDETLLQIQRKCILKNIDAKEESQNIIDIATDEEINEEGKDENKDKFIIFSPPKAELSQKKKLSILSYFSKSESKPKNNVSSEKLEEITSVVNSLKTCQTTNCLKPPKKQEPVKMCQNEKKISLNGINKENVKLAPLFCKKINKVIDSDRQKARLDFLYRGSPSVVKKTENKITEDILHFPTVPHVQQRDESACWSRREICLPLPEVRESDESVIKSTKKFSLEIKNLNFVNNSVVSYSVKVNKEFLHKAKCKYSELNLGLVIDGLKEKRDKYQARAQEIERLKMVEFRKGVSDETGFEELNTLWTEKYKPKSNEILGNENVVKKLKKWLQSWKSFDEELKVLAKSNRGSKNTKESDEDSSDDFLIFGNESYGLKTPTNVCVISGPNGCGKTALVYALANELEFGVLELNASSKRTGKKVLSDLQEATQSHKVHRVNCPQIDTLQKDMKKKKNKKRKKNKKSEILDQANNCKISLILIEDADIVFDDHDEGFFSAIASLVQTSKRPLIFLSNEPNCHNLYSFKTDQCLILEMELPSFYNTCAILDMVSSLEGAVFDVELLKSLIRQNNFDLRKSMLQLQFWIHSGKDPVSLQKNFDLGHLWWGLSKFLFKQDIKHSVKPKGLKRKRSNDLFDSSDDEMEMATKKFKSNLDNSKHFLTVNRSPVRKKSDTSLISYFRVLDLASSLDSFYLSGSQEPVPGFQFKPKDSLSLNENLEESTWVKNRLTLQLSEELVNLSARIFSKNLENDNEDRKLNFESPGWEEIRWRCSQEKASEELSVLVSPYRGRDRRSLHLDYLPVLRNICRVERNRSELNPKRKNRFYHYLNNLGVELSDENLEINCDVFYR